MAVINRYSPEPNRLALSWDAGYTRGVNSTTCIGQMAVRWHSKYCSVSATSMWLGREGRQASVHRNAPTVARREKPADTCCIIRLANADPHANPQRRRIRQSIRLHSNAGQVWCAMHTPAICRSTIIR